MSMIYARVDGNVVYEYPLTKDDINARNNPRENYYPIVYSPIGSYDSDYQRIEQVPVVVGNVVYVLQSIVDKTLEDVINEIAQIAGTFDSNQILLSIDFALIPVNKLNAAIKLISDRVQAFMDNFAQSRLYDNMGSLCGYTGSTDLSFVNEAARGNYLRDMTWRNLYAYLDEIKAGTKPVPMSWQEISSVLPPLTWS